MRMVRKVYIYICNKRNRFYTMKLEYLLCVPMKLRIFCHLAKISSSKFPTSKRETIPDFRKLETTALLHEEWKCVVPESEFTQPGMRMNGVESKKPSGSRNILHLQKLLQGVILNSDEGIIDLILILIPRSRLLRACILENAALRASLKISKLIPTIWGWCNRNFRNLHERNLASCLTYRLYVRLIKTKLAISRAIIFSKSVTMLFMV